MSLQLPAPANRSLEIAEPLIRLTQQIHSGSLLRRGVTKLSSVSHHLRPSTGAVRLRQPIRRGSLVRREYVDPVKPFSYSRSALRFSVMKVMTKNSDFQLSDFKFDFFVDVGNKVSDACGEAFSNLSAVLKSNQSSVSAVLTKSSSWSRSVRKSSRVLVNAVFDRESWSISSESLSAVLVRPSSIAIPGANPIEWKQFRGAVAEIDPLTSQPILRSSFIKRSARVTSEASSARVKSKDIVVERKDVQMKLPECSCVEPEFQKEIAYHTLNQIQPRVVSFEEQVLIIREKLAKLYESEQQWSKAAQLFNGIDLKSGMRVVDDNFRLSKCVILIARLYLEDDYAVNVEAKFEVGIADLDGLDGIMVDVAVYAEFRRDWGEALRMYDDAYHVLRGIVSTSTRLPPIQRVVEIKTVAKQLNFNWQTMAAASLAYGSEKKNNETILVFDLGGGIFDVYVLEVGDGMFEMLSTSGDTHLGGDVFGKRTGNWLASNFKKDEGIDLLKYKGSNRINFEIGWPCYCWSSNIKQMLLIWQKFLLKAKCPTRVVGVLVTLNEDLKNQFVSLTPILSLTYKTCMSSLRGGVGG